jgi:hypothetical protein
VQIGELRVVHVDALELVLDADGLVFAFETGDVEFLGQRRGGAGRVDDDVGVHLLRPVVPDADDFAAVHDGRRDARAEPILRALLAAVADEETLEVGELQDGAGLVAHVVLVGRLEDDLVGVVHHDVVRDAERRHHRREGTGGGLVALTRELVFGLGFEHEDVVVPRRQIAGTLSAGRPGPGYNHVKAIAHSFR